VISEPQQNSSCLERIAFFSQAPQLPLTEYRIFDHFCAWEAAVLINTVTLQTELSKGKAGGEKTTMVATSQSDGFNIV
jgi:hypothetical protein